MLVRTFKLNPLGRPMQVWFKLELNPKGDFCVVSVRAFFVNSFIHITKRYLNWQRKWLSIPNTLNETDTLKRDKEHPHHFYTGDRDRPPSPHPLAWVRLYDKASRESSEMCDKGYPTWLRLQQVAWRIRSTNLRSVDLFVWPIFSSAHVRD